MACFKTTPRALLAFVAACTWLLAGVTFSLSQETPEQTEPGTAELQAFRNRASTLLSSTEKREQAWGAWYVAEHRLVDLAPATEQLLAKLLTQNAPGPDRFLIEALIDALIQNGHKPQRELLAGLWEKGYRDGVIAMAAADARDAAPFLVSLLKVEMDEVEHIAVCNLLSRDAPHRFAGAVLPHIQQLTLSVDVTDPDGETDPGGVDGRFMMRHGDGSVRRDVNLPPRVLYTLSLHPCNGYMVLADGPRTVYLNRRIYRKDGGIGSSRSLINASRAREYWRDCLVGLAYSYAMPDREDFQKLRWEGTVEILWTNLVELRKFAISARADLRAPWLDLCRRLQQKGLLPADTELDKLFPVGVELLDCRKEADKKAVPLPKVEDLLNEDVPLPKEEDLRKQDRDGKGAF